MSDICHICYKKTLKRCKQCQTLYYCSKQCQLKDWNNGHKDECEKIKKGEKYHVFYHIVKAPLDKCNIYIYGTFSSFQSAKSYITKKNHEFPFFNHFVTQLGGESYRYNIKKAVYESSGMVEEEIKKFKLDDSLHNVRIQDNSLKSFGIDTMRYGMAATYWGNMTNSHLVSSDDESE